MRGEDVTFHRSQFDVFPPKRVRMPERVKISKANSHAKKESELGDSKSNDRGEFNLPKSVLFLGNKGEAILKFPEGSGISQKRAEGKIGGQYLVTGRLFEIGLDEGRDLIKAAVRAPYDDSYDIILVLNLREKCIHTAWLNSRHDRHATLNSNSFDCPDKYL